MTNTFFGDMLQSIAERGRSLLDRSHRRGISEQHSANLIEPCEELLSRRGEASGVALAREILARYQRAENRSPDRLLRSTGAAIRPGCQATECCRYGLVEFAH